MIVLILLIRPVVIFADVAIRQNVLLPGVTNLVRWQSHWHVVRQNLPFFQNDFAGRIAQRVMQTANSLRESVLSSIRAVFYIVVYGISAFVLMAMSDWRLGLPTLCWFIGYIVFLRHFVPRMRDLAKSSSEARSLVMGRIVDSYTNILTVKLFAKLADEDAHVREVIDDHQAAMGRHMRLITQFMIWLSIMNALPYATDDRRDGVIGLAFAMKQVAQLLLMCDARDIGLSVNAGDTPGDLSRHSSEGAAADDTPRIFLYDAYPGGIGFSAPLWGMQPELLSKTSALIAGCDCDSGCPMCVGPIGETGPLAKTVALRILEHLLASAGTQALPERAEEVPF